MRMKIALLAAAGSMAMTGAALAQDGDKYYGAIGAGVTLGSDMNGIESRDDNTTPVPFVAEYDTDEGVAVYGALGKYFENNYRGEIELATRTQDIADSPGDGLGFGGLPSSNTIGDITVNTLMLNVFKDFDLDASGRVTPYVGIGLGAAIVRQELNNVSDVGPAQTVGDAANGYRIVVADDDYTLAGQAMAGLSFDFTDNMTLDVRYRYLTTGKTEMGGFVNNEFAPLDSDFMAHEITGGLRWSWGGAAPAPRRAAPEPQPEPQFKTCFDGSRVPVGEPCPIPEEQEVDVPEELELTVYFDYDRATLTDAARTLIAARAAEAREYDIESIVVQGNTDTAGSAAYNQRLSQRRATVVRDALIANGISRSVITIEALGESNPAKPTADGVREPLNRRTEVRFDF